MNLHNSLWSKIDKVNHETKTESSFLLTEVVFLFFPVLMLSLLGIPKLMIIVSWTTAGGGQSHTVYLIILCIHSDLYSLESDAFKIQTRAKKHGLFLKKWSFRHETNAFRWCRIHGNECMFIRYYSVSIKGWLNIKRWFVSFRSEKEELFEADTKTLEPDLVCWSHSVQWLDLGESLVFADLLEQYHTLLRAFCSRALWLQLQVPVAGHTAGSLNLQEHHRGFQVIHRLCQASDTGKNMASAATVPTVWW